MSVTTGRKTVLILDRSDPSALDRPADVHSRTSAQIARQRPGPRPNGAPASKNVSFLGGDAWILLWRQAELAQVAQTNVGGALGAADVSVAAGMGVENMARKQTDLPWVLANAGLATVSVPAFIRRVPAGTATAPKLAADEAAYPKPIEASSQSYPVDRILCSLNSFQANCPWMLRYLTPAAWHGNDLISRFYYGGSAEVLPLTETGGSFSLELHGSGRASLSESYPQDSANPWRQRFEFQFAEAHAGGRFMDCVSIVPYGLNRTSFLAASAEWMDSPFGPLGAELTMGGLRNRLHPPIQTTYHDLITETGHIHRASATGAGPVRVDLRQDLRIPFTIIRCSYPSLAVGDSGYLVDSPFAVSYPMTTGTPMTLVIDAFKAPGTNIAGQIYDADTHAVLAQDAFGHFLSNSGQRRYYVSLQFTSADGLQTPVLWGYSVRVAGLFRANWRNPTVVNIDSVDVQGPDTTPDHEQGTVRRRDIRNELAILRVRDRIRSSISLVGPNGAVLSHLFEGETLQPEGDWRGKPGWVYPSADWRDFDDLRLVGMWARCADQFSLSTENFGRDVNASTDAQWVPWKVTDILRELFHNCGFDNSQLDLPDLPIRLWSSLYYTVKPEDYWLAFGTDLATAIRKLAWDYLGMVVLWDANAGSAGMWRLIRNPTPPYSNFIAGFYLSNPGWTVPHLPHVAAGYPAATTYVTHFLSWVKASEVNIVTVRGVRKDGAGGTALLQQIARNENSISNPGHPDYLGRAIPVVFPPDPTLNTQAAVDWATRVIYDASAHSQKWFELQSPLLLVWDPQDRYQARPRVPRINDLIQVGGVSALVRSCNPNYRTDLNETMTLQGQFLVW